MEETTDNDYISTFDRLESLSYDNPIRVITTWILLTHKMIQGNILEWLLHNHEKVKMFYGLCHIITI